MFYSLAHLEDSFHAENTYKFIALAPCFVASDDIDFDTAVYSTFKFRDYGVYAYKGPNWEQDKKTVCDNFPQDACDRFVSYEDSAQPMSIMSENHWD